MSIYRGPFTSLDLNQGVWLDVERDDLGNTKCLMTIEGEEIEITQKQYDALIKGRAEAYRAIAESERERIKRVLDTSRECVCKPSCRTDVNIYAFVLEELGFDLFKLIDGE